MLSELKNKILKGYKISKDEAINLLNEDLDKLCISADEIRKYFCGNNFDICTIINGKCGNCSEDCKYCAQSVKYNTNIEKHSLCTTETILKDAKYNADKGIIRYSVVTSGRKLLKKDLDSLCRTYAEVKEKVNISLCASHGLLNYEEFLKLKNSGVSRYHNNLETSRNFFPKICTTHTYDEKIKAIKYAKEAGLEVCSGGILGLGESMLDRIDMLFELRELGIKSIPVNILNPIKGTPLESNKPLSEEEILRSIAIFRFIIPDAFIRLAGGRGLFNDKGKSAFLSGANAAISGDMLTTSGITIQDDLKMLSDLNYRVSGVEES
ncbi:biotin synthase [Clostridium sp. DSM 8431]|uniref:biotin synthase BioB n=1 Tax=Clostridium sp. DSM 8431 TaxID=1761781 RepID=UPI0008E172D9|nr:biotin synthase BioB [Clostridium sp. DSM 8431]SFU84920.1 biotin synthase [Clostridium sp. DSM 8431]